MAAGNEPNPYQAPKADDVPEPALRAAGGLVLATRTSRLAAAVAETLLQVVLMMPAQFALGVYADFPQMRAQSNWELAAWVAVGFVVYVAVNGYFLAKYGQTIGKRLVGIRIVNAKSGQMPRLTKLVVYRYLPQQLAAAVPVLGIWAVFIDVLFIFRSDFRCVHDHIAGTLVVRGNP